MDFRHERVDPDPPSGFLSMCLCSDLTGNGRPDIIVGANGQSYPAKGLLELIERRGVPTFPGVRERVGLGETNLFWYENPGWERHRLAYAPPLGVGGALGDITGNGREDLLAGQHLPTTVLGTSLAPELYWFEQPSDPRRPWKRRTITDEFVSYHDVAIADVDGDGEPEVVALAVHSETLYYYDVPADPTQSPWPVENRHVVSDAIDAEGLEVRDIDGDGIAEMVAGPNVFSREDGDWVRESVANDWKWTRIAVADLDGDGVDELVFSEGDRPYHDGVPGRVGWADPPEWEMTVLNDDLQNPHSLQCADFTGDGSHDIYVAEMGLGTNDNPRQLLYSNDGSGGFTERCIVEGTPTHEAKAVDLTGNGRPDIVGKSYTPTHHVDVWYNEGN